MIHAGLFTFLKAVHNRMGKDETNQIHIFFIKYGWVITVSDCFIWKTSQMLLYGKSRFSALPLLWRLKESGQKLLLDLHLQQKKKVRNTIAQGGGEREA